MFSKKKILILIILIGLFLRLNLSDLDTIRPDEDFTIARLNNQENPQSLDINPPLYYLIVKPFWDYTQNIVTVRFVGIIISTLTIPIIFLIGKELFGTKKGLIASLLFAIYPVSIVYSNHARTYVLLMFLSALAILMVVKHFKKNNAIGIGISYAALFWTHYASIFFVITQALTMVFLKITKNISTKTLWFFLLAIFLAILLSLPLIPEVSIHKQNYDELIQGHDTKHTGVLLMAWVPFIKNSIQVNTGFEIKKGPNGIVLGIRKNIGFLFIAIIANILAITGLIRMFNQKNQYYLLFASYYLAPLIFLFFVAFTNLKYSINYTLASAPILPILIASNDITKRNWMFIVLLIFGWIFAIFYFWNVLKSPDWLLVGLP